MPYDFQEFYYLLQWSSPERLLGFLSEMLDGFLLLYGTPRQYIEVGNGRAEHILTNTDYHRIAPVPKPQV